VVGIYFVPQDFIGKFSLGYRRASVRLTTPLVSSHGNTCQVASESKAFTTESLYRPLVPVPVKVLCYAAIADLFTYLPQSKANPGAIDVRQKLQLASWMSLWPLKVEKYR